MYSSDSNFAIQIIAHYIPLFGEEFDTGDLSPTHKTNAYSDTFQPPLPASTMMHTKKHSGKRKSYIPSDRPRNKADRDALKYAKTPSMYGYIKLPVGRPPKTIDSQTIGLSPSTADTALAPATAAAASRAPSVKVKMSGITRGSYQKYDDNSGQDAWVSSMLLNNDRKIANEAMFEANPQAVVPRQTLNSLLISAKAKINNVTSGDLGTEYDIYQRTSEASDMFSLTTNSDRELLQHIAKSRDEMNRGMSRKEMIVLIAELFGVPYKTAENHFDYLIKSKQLNELKTWRPRCGSSTNYHQSYCNHHPEIAPYT